MLYQHVVWTPSCEAADIPKNGKCRSFGALLCIAEGFATWRILMLEESEAYESGTGACAEHTRQGTNA
jgi:hypothetical protein